MPVFGQLKAAYCHVFRFRDGRIAEVTEYFDTQLASAVFGV